MEKIRTTLYIHKWKDNRCVLSTIRDWYNNIQNTINYEYHYFRTIGPDCAGIFNYGPTWFNSTKEAFQEGTGLGFNVSGVVIYEGD